jgi:hypothetical protein
MRLTINRTTILAVVVGLLAAATPAKADGWGWGHRGWGGGNWGWGGWNNGGVAVAAALGGFALGAVAGAAAQPGYGVPYGECYFVDRPVTDGWGNVVEYRRARVCQ